METFESRTEEDTLRIGEQIGRRIRSPHTLLLDGPLGSGKTVLTRGVTRGLGVYEPATVRSPSFTLVNQHPSPLGDIYHVDLYRLNSRRDQYSTGLDEILAGNSVVIIEWAEKLLLEPQNPLAVHIRLAPSSSVRIIEVES